MAEIGHIAACLGMTGAQISVISNRALQPYSQALAFVWRHCQHRSVEEIATDLEIDVSQVDYFVERGRKQYQHQLEKAGGLHA